MVECGREFQRRVAEGTKELSEAEERERNIIKGQSDGRIEKESL